MSRIFDILGVDSDRCYRDRYVDWLGANHNVQTVGDGRSALEAVGDDLDLVVLEREVPDTSGQEVARRIRDRNPGCHILMVGSEAADFDIVECPIDSYLQKPLDRSDLDGVIEQYRTQTRYQSALEEFFRLTSKLGALEAEHTRETLLEDGRYRRLTRRVEQKRAEVDEALSKHETDWSLAFKTCTRAVDGDVVSGP